MEKTKSLLQTSLERIRLQTRLRQDRDTARRRWQNSEITLSIYLYKVAAQLFWHEGLGRLKISCSLIRVFRIQ